MNADAQRPPARVLLHARLRRPEQQGHRLHAEHERVPLDRRRQDAGSDRQRHARRPPRSVDRSRRLRSTWSIGNDGGGAIVVDVASRSAAGAAQDFPTAQFYHVITTRARAVSTSAARSRTTARCACRATPARRRRRRRRRHRRSRRTTPAAASPATSRRIRRIPTSSSPAPTTASFLTRLNRRTGELQGGRRRIRASSPASRRATSRSAGSGPIRSSSRRSIRTCSTPRRSACGRRPTAARRGTAISGDLTRHDPKTMGESGGPITHDMNSPEIYGTVFSLAPGKTDVNIIWAGSDDGIVHVTRDGGKTWTNVTPKDMPDFGRVSQIDASSFDAGTALRRGEEAAARRLRAVHLPHARLRHGPGRRSSPASRPNDYMHVGARGSDAPRAALRRHAARRLRLVRRRRHVAVAVAEPARHPDLGSRSSRRARSRSPRTAAASTSSTISCRCGRHRKRRRPRLPRSCSSRRTPSAAADRQRSPTPEVAGGEPVARDSRRRRTRRADDSRPHGWTGTRRARPRRRGTGLGAWGRAGSSGPWSANGRLRRAGGRAGPGKSAGCASG